MLHKTKKTSNQHVLTPHPAFPLLAITQAIWWHIIFIEASFYGQRESKQVPISLNKQYSKL